MSLKINAAFIDKKLKVFSTRLESRQLLLANPEFRFFPASDWQECLNAAVKFSSL